MPQLPRKPERAKSSAPGTPTPSKPQTTFKTTPPSGPSKGSRLSKHQSSLGTASSNDNEPSISSPIACEAHFVRQVHRRTEDLRSLSENVAKCSRTFAEMQAQLAIYTKWLVSSKSFAEIRASGALFKSEVPKNADISVRIHPRSLLIFVSQARTEEWQNVMLTNLAIFTKFKHSLSQNVKKGGKIDAPFEVMLPKGADCSFESERNYDGRWIVAKLISIQRHAIQRDATRCEVLFEVRESRWYMYGSIALISQILYRMSTMADSLRADNPHAHYMVEPGADPKNCAALSWHEELIPAQKDRADLIKARLVFPKEWEIIAYDVNQTSAE